MMLCKHCIVKIPYKSLCRGRFSGQGEPRRVEIGKESVFRGQKGSKNPFCHLRYHICLLWRTTLQFMYRYDVRNAIGGPYIRPCKGHNLKAFKAEKRALKGPKRGPLYASQIPKNRIWLSRNPYIPYITRCLGSEKVWLIRINHPPTRDFVCLNRGFSPKPP